MKLDDVPQFAKPLHVHRLIDVLYPQSAPKPMHISRIHRALGGEPESMSETQDRIVDYLDSIKVDVTISRIGQGVNLSNERTRVLINDLITMKRVKVVRPKHAGGRNAGATFQLVEHVPELNQFAYEG